MTECKQLISKVTASDDSSQQALEQAKKELEKGEEDIATDKNSFG